MVRLGLTSLARQEEKETERQTESTCFVRDARFAEVDTASKSVLWMCWTDRRCALCCLERDGDVHTLRGVLSSTLLAGLFSLRQEEGLPHSQALKENTPLSMTFKLKSSICLRQSACLPPSGGRKS